MQFNALVIDDDEDDFIILEDLLAPLFPDSQLHWERNGERALDRLQETTFDLCLLDINLGRDNGIELLRKAKSNGFTNPIIMLTGQASEELDQQAQAIGAADFLVKNNLDSYQLSRSIRYALASKAMTESRIQQAQAEAENRAKSRFLANLSHEIRSPLASMMGYSELLLQEKLPNEVLDKLNVIYRNGEHLLALLEDVLDLSKIEAGKVEVTTSKMDLLTCYQTVFKSLSVVAQNKSLTLNFKCRSNIPRFVFADETRLQQILSNIINNAIKYTPSGTISVVIDPVINGDTCTLRHQISDTGVGISPEKLADVFEPFSQVTPAGETVSGAGLGLTICRDLLALMNGSIDISSELGIGTCVSYQLPVAIAAGSPLSDFNTPLASSRSASHNQYPDLKVLVVDDLEDVRQTLVEIAQTLGATVYSASNGLQAERLLAQTNTIDVVLMDIYMPQQDGLETAKNLCYQNTTSYLCALSAAATTDLKTQALSAGFDEFIAKPASIATITAVFERAQAKRGERNQTPQSKAPQASYMPSVLLVDDEVQLLKVTSALLANIGWHSEIANNLQTLKHQAETKKEFRWILLDLHLPERHGIELINTVTTLFPKTPVIIISGSEPSTEIANHPSVARYLKKPVNLQQLSDAVNTQL